MTAGTARIKKSGIALLNLLCGHEGVISHVAWAPVGNALASCSLDQTLRLWDRQGEQAAKVIRAHDFNVTGLAWAPQGQALATVSDDRRILVWAYPSGDSMGGLEGHDHGICQAAWSPSGNHLVTVANSKTVYVWDVRRMELKCALRGHREVLRGVAFAPKGDYLATVSEDATIRLWRGSSFTPDKKLAGHHAAVNAAAWSSQGLLATASDDQTVRIWDPRKGRCEHEVIGHSGPVKAVAFSPDGRLMATRSWDQTLRIWRCDTWRDVLVIEEETASPFPTLAFHAGLPVLASVGALDRVIRVWELDMEGLTSAEAATDSISFRDEETAMLIERGYNKLAMAAPKADTPGSTAPQPTTHVPTRVPAPATGTQPVGSTGRQYLCPSCREPITESQANRRLAAGFRSLRCPVCDVDILLANSPQSLPPAVNMPRPEPAPRGLRDWAGADKVTMALLFTDIVGSTDLANRLGDDVMKTIRRSHFEKAREHIRACDGFEIKTMGDAFMVAFRTVRSGFDCALKMNGDTGHAEIAIRAGLHVGEVEIEENDAFGLMVNFCSRVLGQAAGPEVWLSDQAWNQLLREDTQRYANLPWTCNENITLKGFPGTYRLWAL
ncbi:MAG: adenylate/guanylate cyclase domain-containing protein [Acidobacteriota bacterium]|nr:adenylate/guanylate cyclase domain-containing protein [Acidobacteriota bacterium]